jgi:hypothetical protein
LHLTITDPDLLEASRCLLSIEVVARLKPVAEAMSMVQHIQETFDALTPAGAMRPVLAACEFVEAEDRDVMPLPKGTKFPADPKERLDAILKDCFGNSRLALARAASVNRALVNRWPPGSKMVMVGTC